MNSHTYTHIHAYIHWMKVKYYIKHIRWFWYQHFHFPLCFSMPLLLMLLFVVLVDVVVQHDCYHLSAQYVYTLRFNIYIYTDSVHSYMHAISHDIRSAIFNKWTSIRKSPDWISQQTHVHNSISHTRKWN